MTTLRSLIFMVVFPIWTVGLCLLYLPLLACPRPWTVVAARFWVGSSLTLLGWICGLRHEVRGRENLPQGPAIIAAKHQSAWDTLVWHALVPDPAYIIKKELLRLPLIGWFLAKSRMVAVDRAAGMKALKHMVDGAREAVAAGRTVIIFPEGTRTAPGQSLPYHSGVAMLYGGLDVPVIPVALNSGLFWGRNKMIKRPGVITLEILPAMPAGLDRKGFAPQLAATIEAASRRLQVEAEHRFPHLGSVPVAGEQ